MPAYLKNTDPRLSEASRLWKAGEPVNSIVVTLRFGALAFLRLRRANPQWFPPRPQPQPKPGPLESTRSILSKAARLRARGCEWSEVVRVLAIPEYRFWQAIGRHKGMWQRMLAEARAELPADADPQQLSRTARERHRKLSIAALMRALLFPWREVGAELGVTAHSAMQWTRLHPALWQRCKDEAARILERHNGGEPVEDDDVVRLIRKAASRMQPAPQLDTVTQLMQQVSELTRRVNELTG